MIKSDYMERTYAGWLGKIIGIRLGSPIEGWSHDQIKKIYGEINNYLVDYKDYAADDDSNGPLFFVRAIKDYSYKIEEISAKEMGYTWLNYAPENHGFFWWGGYGISTEHTAYYNLKNDIDAPISGSSEQNGLSCSEQIGGQIFSDCWGFVVPGNPALAARYAKKMASVSHDGGGINGAMFVAGCISAAYMFKDIKKVIETGLSLIPKDSEYFLAAQSVIDFYLKDKDKKWENCLRFVHDNYGYDKYPGNCHIIPNSAVMVLSMLYGEGDFSKTLCICNMCGWDTDCNAGNVGSILGVMVGIEEIDDKWIEPINDLLIASSVIGGLNIQTIAKSAETFCELGYQIAEEAPPKELDSYNNEEYMMSFHLPKSTQAMRAKSNDKHAEITLKNVVFHDSTEYRCLKIIANRLQSDTEVIIYHKTYYQPEDLHDSRYDPAFTPILYPGQIVKTALYNDSGFKVLAKVYVKDINNNKSYFSETYELGNEWTEIEYQIPDLKNGLIKEAGVLLSKVSNSKSDKVLNVNMKYFGFSGKPKYEIDFKNNKIEDYGFGHASIHKDISQFTYKNGLWELDGEYLSGSCCDEGEAYTGYYDQKNYSYECIVNPQKGLHHLIYFRVQGGIRSYAFGFYGENRAALLMKHKAFHILREIAYEFETHKDYHFEIRVQNDRIITFINGEKIFECQDNSYPYGQIGVGVLKGSHCHFKNISVQVN
jgi:ADP-ribosylglycohydrolase